LNSTKLPSSADVIAIGDEKFLAKLQWFECLDEQTKVFCDLS
jgi:hypothetical protein